MKQNLLYFSGLCVGKKNSTNLNDLRISMTKKTSNTYLPGLLHEKLSFLIGTALIQRDAAVWMLESALKTYKPEASIFPQCLHKVLFMVASEEFWRVDGECNFICLFPSSKIPLGIPPCKVTKESFDAILIQISYTIRLGSGQYSSNKIIKT